MKLKGWLYQKQNFILTLLLLGALGSALAIRFDYYYDLNDDVLMKNIIGGCYTGVPEGHNIQMLWLLSWTISLLYKLVRALPWYGIFLWGCQFGSMFLILIRSMKICRQIRSKVAVGIVEIAFFAAMMMEHLVSVQYTVTCAMLAAAAAFWFLTEPQCETSWLFVKKQLPAVCLVFLAFLLRSEMLCLMLPLICVAGVIRWSLENKIFAKENFIKYFGVFGLILIAMGIGQGTHMLAYSSSEWRAFDEFFNQRTELYDFQKVPLYDENSAFYESIGITKAEQVLFENYNFGMDESIDENIVGQIADYAAGLHKEEISFSQKLMDKFSIYIYRLTHGADDGGSDFPWNGMLFLFYVAVFLLLIGAEWNTNKKLAVVNACWKLFFLFVVRSSLWMFILMRGRDPVRITHSLYYEEVVILGGILFMILQQGNIGGRGKTVCLTMLICVGVLSMFLLPQKVEQVDGVQKYQQQTNASYLELYQYFEEHAENFYFIDVYSWSPYIEKMFSQVDNTLVNYDIMGGWLNKSPLYEKKLQKFQIPSMEDGLLFMENVYFVRKDIEDMSWLAAYYEEHGVTIHINLEKTIDSFEIYSVRME